MVPEMEWRLGLFVVCLTQVSLPAGVYTVRISTTDPEYPTADNGKDCRVQSIPLSQLPLENSCAEGEDVECFVLPRVAVRPGEEFEIEGSYEGGCKALNSIQVCRRVSRVCVWKERT